MNQCNLLLVDDDVVFAQTLERALTRRGYEVRRAQSTAEAREILKEYSPNYALLDMRLPGELGISLVKELKEQFENIRILMLSGYGSVKTAVESMKLGAADFLTKPVGVEEIIAALTSEEPEVSTELEVPSLSEVEWDYIQRVVSDCEGNISHAAKELGIHRRSLQRKLQKVSPK